MSDEREEKSPKAMELGELIKNFLEPPASTNGDGSSEAKNEPSAERLDRLHSDGQGGVGSGPVAI